MGKAIQASPELLLRLYITGHAPNSVLAVANARAICDEHFGSRYQLEIVDLLNEPERAFADGIIVSPTLVKFGPLPVQKIIGNLADRQQVVLTLGAP